MKSSITSVQVSILETKRLRSMALMAEIDAVHRQAAEILEIGEFDGNADDHLADYLGGNGSRSLEETLEAIGVLVNAPPVRVYDRDIPVSRTTA